jgi:hypothetical protein
MRATREIEKREIVSVFRQVAEKNIDVRLLNVYKGVPVSYEAKIIEVADNSALIRTDKTQLVCLENEGKTYIQTLYLPKIVYARVLDIDVQRNESVLGDFEYVSGKVGARTQVRVIPERIIKGCLHLVGTDKACEGKLADISLDGLGFYLPGEAPLPTGFEKGAKIRIDLALPGVMEKKRAQGEQSEERNIPQRHHTIRLEEDYLPCKEEVDWLSMENKRPVSLMGEIMNIHSEAQAKRWRIGIRIDPHDPSKKEISHYITHRQAEIMREIRHAYGKKNQG